MNTQIRFIAKLFCLSKITQHKAVPVDPPNYVCCMKIIHRHDSILVLSERSPSSCSSLSSTHDCFFGIAKQSLLLHRCFHPGKKNIFCNFFNGYRFSLANGTVNPFLRWCTTLKLVYPVLVSITMGRFQSPIQSECQ